MDQRVRAPEIHVPPGTSLETGSSQMCLVRMRSRWGGGGPWTSRPASFSEEEGDARTHRRKTTREDAAREGAMWPQGHQGWDGQPPPGPEEDSPARAFKGPEGASTTGGRPTPGVWPSSPAFCTEPRRGRCLQGQGTSAPVPAWGLRPGLSAQTLQALGASGTPTVGT